MKTFVACLTLAVSLVLGWSVVASGGESQTVLFIGNSHTFTNDLPAMTATVLADNGIDLEHDSITVGGRSLQQHAADAQVRSAIASGDYDIIILQEQSELPAHGPSLEGQTIPAVIDLVALADAAGSEVILFETWARRGGSDFTGHTSYESMQQAVTSGYWQMASASGATIAPVGSTWARSMQANDIALHSPDGNHAAPAGTHLASLVMARTILGASLTSVPSNGIPDADADQLALLLW